MKIQLYIIDYHLKKSSGLTTYVDHLTNGLSKIQEISLNYIGINAKIDSEVERHRIKNETHLLYSNELVLSNKSSNDKLISLLKEDIISGIPVIFILIGLIMLLLLAYLSNNLNAQPY